MLLLCLAAGGLEAAPGYQVEIDLQQQMAYLIRGRRLVLSSPISSDNLLGATTSKTPL